MPAIMNQKEQLIDDAIRSLYEVISFSEGAEPDWARMREVFTPDARITRITPEGVDSFDVDSFQAMATEMLDLGVYTGFHERETARRADVFGAFAHVLSAYETKHSPDAEGCLARGVNSIQLLWTGRAWRVFSLLWDEDAKLNRLDIDGLFTTEVSHG